jgi:hypothetical protein
LSNGTGYSTSINGGRTVSIDEAVEETVEEAVTEAVEETANEPEVEVSVEPTTVIVESDNGESAVTEIADGLELAERIRQIAREEAAEVETRLMQQLPGLVEAYAPAPVIVTPPEPEHEEPDEEPRNDHWWHRKLW